MRTSLRLKRGLKGVVVPSKMYGKNLFLCDGSSLVTSGRGQPTLTISALAYRAADRITALARRGEI